MLKFKNPSSQALLVSISLKYSYFEGSYVNDNTFFFSFDSCLTLVFFFSLVAPAIHEMKSHGVGLGRTALLRCEAAAMPSPTFEWYKGEKR